MKVKTYYEGRIINLIYPTQYDLASSLMRVQEFCESPISALRGKKFTFEQCFDAFNKRKTGENYFTKWNGFNIPGHIVRKFIREFDEFWDKELEWIDVVKNLSGRQKFCLIGSHTGDKDYRRVVDHELAHAFYYLDKTYRESINVLHATWPNDNLKKVYAILKEDGYSKIVYKDELQAYYSTSTVAELKKWKLKSIISDTLLREYREGFKNWKKYFI